MGQIEELEKELATIQFQVDRIQHGLDKCKDTVGLIKQNQSNLMAQQAAMAQRLQQAQQSQQLQQPQPQSQSVPQTPVQPVQPQIQPAQQTPLYQAVQNPVQTPQFQAVQQPVYRTVQQAQPNQQNVVNRPVYVQPGVQYGGTQNKKSVESAESWIGKHLMSILASVLIFVALILFASLIIPYLGDGIKITMMFTASIGISAFAYYQHKKKPENTFFTSLLACGIGCCYISILVTRISFEAIGDIGMYVLMLLWGLAVLFLARKENWLFQVISNAGFVISALFAFAMKDESLILPLLAYLIVMGGAHQYIFWKNSLQRKIQCGVNLAIIAQYSAVLRFAFDGGVSYTIAFVIMTILALAIFVYFTFGDLFKENSSNPYFAVASAVTLCITYLGLLSGFDAPDMVRVIGLFAIGVLAEVATLLIDKKNPENKYSLFSLIWITAWLMIVSVVAYTTVTEFFDTGVLFVFLAPLALWGIKTGDKFYKWQAFILAATMVFVELFSGAALMFCVMAFAYAVLVFVIEAFIANKAMEIKFTYYVFALITLMMLMYTLCNNFEFDKEWTRLFMTIPAGLVNAAMIFAGLDRDSQGESHKDYWKLLNVINIIGMLVGLFDMAISDGAAAIAISLVYTVSLASVNLKHHIEGNGDEKLYAGIKYGIILLVALYSYSAKGYIASVCVLAYAIVCIIIGFSKRFGAKELRIYGLILSMICVVKFIMIDTTYENTLGHAISFLISGILCFGISAIYNHYEKKESQENGPESSNSNAPTMQNTGFNGPQNGNVG
ncbi:DUF2339 domain-containing protein [Butyrivibrio sp. VCB2006]|uniref:DUF2339 domain-containing protein n=1 Tax=Butyrivibrio sp. VCB2006 TaxID=1280679 RepID=UPI0004113A4E|nr:DUF2339 domain-containing protein [Butyrivibrio sp. VCB2006]